MYWRSVKHTLNRRFGQTVACAVAYAACLTGCAKPAGPLFPPIVDARVWPAPPDRARMRFVGIIEGSDDLQAGKSGGEMFASALRGPRPSLEFASLHALAFHPSGDLLAVTDPAGGAVHLIDLQERTHTRVRGWDDQRFETPVGAAWVDQSLCITDASRREVVRLDASGQYQGTFGQDQLQRPVGIAHCVQTDAIYVVDGSAHRIEMFKVDGTHVQTLGGPGSERGELHYPTHVYCDGSRLYVSDSGNFRVQVWDVQGRPLFAFGAKGDAAGDFAMPKGLATDADGNIFVVDAHFENVQVFDPAGRLLMAFGEEGHERGCFSLPAGIAIDKDHRVWVAESGNRRLQVFRLLRDVM